MRCSSSRPTSTEMSATAPTLAPASSGRPSGTSGSGPCSLRCSRLRPAGGSDRRGFSRAPRWWPSSSCWVPRHRCFPLPSGSSRACPPSGCRRAFSFSSISPSRCWRAWDYPGSRAAAGCRWDASPSFSSTSPGSTAGRTRSTRPPNGPTRRRPSSCSTGRPPSASTRRAGGSCTRAPSRKLAAGPEISGRITRCGPSCNRTRTPPSRSRPATVTPGSRPSGASTCGATTTAPA